MRLGGPQRRSGRHRKDKFSCPCRDTNPGRSAHRYTELSHLLKLTLCLINETPRLKDVWESGGVYPNILNFSIEWRFTLLLLYLQERVSEIHWVGFWGESRCLYGRCGGKKNLLPLPRIELLFLGYPARSWISTYPNESRECLSNVSKDLQAYTPSHSIKQKS
jgi:hypothetical protein